ncbi:MAG TPA: hypothetical protein PLK82_10655, partial [Bacteroidales bacterium]|nr:hypothetical protein [Bacteroidales bacterium]
MAILLIFTALNLFGQSGEQAEIVDAPGLTPTITGDTAPCVDVPGYVYFTEQWKTGYIWVVTGGTITAGGSVTDYSITITWTTLGPRSLIVYYNGGNGPGVLNINVHPTFPVSAVITASANPICPGVPVTFTATVTNGGTLPTFNWFVNGVNVTLATPNPTYTYTPNNNDSVHCQVTSTLPCVSGNPASSPMVHMIVTTNFPVGVVVTPSSNPACQGDTIVFSAEAYNGGNSPSYLWKVNGNSITGATADTFTYVPGNGDVITCTLLSSLTCTSGNPATSDAVTMTVSPNQPVSVTVAPSSNPVCNGNLVNFTATPVNGGTAPQYTWMVNGDTTAFSGPAMTYPPADQDLVYCILTSNALCKSGNPAYSAPVAMNVQPYAPASVSISASATTVCSGQFVTLTATPVNGGTTPQYTWKIGSWVVQTGTSSTYTYQPNNGDQAHCLMTSALLCATGSPANSNTITLTVSPSQPPAVTISASSNPTCAGTPVVFTANPVNGGPSPGFQWFVNGSPVAGATNATYTYPPSDGNTVFCRMTSSALCSQGTVVQSTSINMMVSSGWPVSVSITASENPVCPGQTVLYTATAVNGGSPVFTWRVNGIDKQSGSSANYSYSPLNGEVVTCQVLSNLSCAIGNPALSNAITMTVSTTLNTSVTITANHNPSCEGQSVTFTATAQNPGASPVYKWRVNNIELQSDSIPSFSRVMFQHDSVQCELISSYSCKSPPVAVSNKIIMTVNPNL